MLCCLFVVRQSVAFTLTTFREQGHAISARLQSVNLPSHLDHEVASDTFSECVLALLQPLAGSGTCILHAAWRRSLPAICFCAASCCVDQQHRAVRQHHSLARTHCSFRSTLIWGQPIHICNCLRVCKLVMTFERACKLVMTFEHALRTRAGVPAQGCVLRLTHCGQQCNQCIAHEWHTELG